jgi:DNA-binding PadR family transcriptional regulator
MRRKAGFLIPIEVAILEAAVALREAGQSEVHGYELAKVVQDIRDATRLTAYGTLYKALSRLEREGFLASRWEDPSLAATESRPRRRFYRLTVEGERALADARAAERETTAQRPAAAAVR